LARISVETPKGKKTGSSVSRTTQAALPAVALPLKCCQHMCINFTRGAQRFMHFTCTKGFPSPTLRRPPESFSNSIAIARPLSVWLLSFFHIFISVFPSFFWFLVPAPKNKMETTNVGNGRRLVC